jgi:hypothetical protein
MAPTLFLTLRHKLSQCAPSNICTRAGECKLDASLSLMGHLGTIGAIVSNRATLQSHIVIPDCADALVSQGRGGRSFYSDIQNAWTRGYDNTYLRQPEIYSCFEDPCISLALAFCLPMSYPSLTLQLSFKDIIAPLLLVVNSLQWYYVTY